MKKFIFITGLLMSIFFYSCREEDHGILPPIEGGGTIEVKDGRVTVNPAEYLYAIRNPMKGLREFFGPGYDKVRTNIRILTAPSLKNNAMEYVGRQ